MWHLYIFMAMLTAGIVIKLVHPLMGKGRHKHADAMTRDDVRFCYSLVAAVPFLSLGLYLYLGNPDLPGHPAMLMDYQEMNQRHLAFLAGRPAQILVKKDPHNVGALTSLGQVNLRSKNYKQAIEFYQLALQEAIVQDLMEKRLIAVMLGEIQIEANQGKVGDDAIKTFNYVLKLHPENPLARYYLALKKAQDGQYDEALAEWSVLLEGGHPEIYWKQRVRQSIADTLKKMGR